MKDRIFIIPRVYTNKPRTKGTGYKGMLHQPDPEKKEDMLAGIIAIRQMHTDVVRETGFTCAEEMLYPENHRYLSDLLAYVAVGARSVEDQLHRLVASGIGIPAGMKNPTGGDLSCHDEFHHCRPFRTDIRLPRLGGPYDGQSHGACHPARLCRQLRQEPSELPLRGSHRTPAELMPASWSLENPSVIVDCNHANSGKQYLEQIRISKDVLHSVHVNPELKGFVKGLMIESYLEDGNQKVGGGVYGKSITDPCLGWEKSERLILELADLAE